MKYINVRQLTRNLKEATVELPARVTNHGIPIFDIIPIGEKNFEKKILKNLPEHIEIQKEWEPTVKAVHQVAQSGKVCEWDKTFKCTSPGIVKKGNKWFCVPHSLE